MYLLGNTEIYLGLALAVYSLIILLAGIKTKQQLLVNSGKGGVLGVFICTAVASAVLLYLLGTSLFLPLIKAVAFADHLQVDMHYRVVDSLADGSIQEENNIHGKVGSEEYKAKLAACKGHLITAKQNLRQFVE